MTPSTPQVDSAHSALGWAGGVDHAANKMPSLTISMIGWQYQVVSSRVVDGACIETPVDDALFDGIGEARVALRKARAAA